MPRVEESIVHLPKRVTTEMNEHLLFEFNLEEVSAALHQMTPLKSLGPDGFPMCFFEDNWEDVGKEVCATTLDFFNMVFWMIL